MLDDEGKGETRNVIAALDWILENHQLYNIRVINMSLGKVIQESVDQDLLVLATEAVWDAGVVVVASAGNYGEHGEFTVVSPGNSRKIITVGSVTDNSTGNDFSDDYVSSFSSRGPAAIDLTLKPDILAPGSRIIAPAKPGSHLKDLVADAGVDCDQLCKPHYARLSGTSMAAGVTSGAVALLLADDPTLSPATVKARLMRSARKIAGDPVNTGAGVLDIRAALTDDGVVSGQALSPQLLPSADGSEVLIEDTATLWGSSDWAAANVWESGASWSVANRPERPSGIPVDRILRVGQRRGDDR